MQNSAGAFSTADLHRAMEVTQEKRFARVMNVVEWVMAMIEG